MMFWSVAWIGIPIIGIWALIMWAVVEWRYRGQKRHTAEMLRLISELQDDLKVFRKSLS